MTPPSTQPSGYDDHFARKHIQFEHVKDLWLFLASLLAFLTVIRVLRLLFRLFILSRRVNYVEPLEPEKHDVESTTSTIKTRVNSPIYRLQSAIATTFRIVAFRWSIPIGPGSFASISELTFIFGYMAAMFLWLFLDSTFISLNLISSRFIYFV
jgi:ferric-chelate reductase